MINCTLERMRQLRDHHRSSAGSYRGRDTEFCRRQYQWHADHAAMLDRLLVLERCIYWNDDRCPSGWVWRNDPDASFEGAMEAAALVEERMSETPSEYPT